MDESTARLPYLSVIIPVYNEEENVTPLTTELMEVLNNLNKSFEVIFVDDGSTDRSLATLKELQKKFRDIRIVKFRRNCGQTAGFDAGIRAARGEVIVTMDADLQNDPYDIPRLLEKIGDFDAVCGWRQKRNDNFIRRISSRIANGVRNRLSGETIRDVGCSLKAFRSVYAKKMKLFNGMHRFFPTLIKMEGGRVTEVPVNHRQRTFGTPKYNIRNRIVRSFIDLLAVCWMKKRRLNYEIEE
jgi:glycosyltransferase involved in cell wall biosynthesis